MERGVRKPDKGEMGQTSERKGNEKLMKEVKAKNVGSGKGNSEVDSVRASSGQNKSVPLEKEKEEKEKEIKDEKKEEVSAAAKNRKRKRK